MEITIGFDYSCDVIERYPTSSSIKYPVSIQSLRAFTEGICVGPHSVSGEGVENYSVRCGGDAEIYIL